MPKDSPINYNLQELEEEKRNLNKDDDEEKEEETENQRKLRLLIEEKEATEALLANHKVKRDCKNVNKVSKRELTEEFLEQKKQEFIEKKKAERAAYYANKAEADENRAITMVSRVERLGNRLCKNCNIHCDPVFSLFNCYYWVRGEAEGKKFVKRGNCQVPPETAKKTDTGDKEIDAINEEVKS